MIPPPRYDVPRIRVLLRDSNGAPVSGIASNDANLRIAVLADNAASPTQFSGSNIEAIAAIGTYASPASAAHCRWGEVSAGAMPGLYELQFHAGLWGAAASRLEVRVWDAAGTPRWVQTYATVPVYMPVRVDHVRDALQTARDLGANLDAAVSTRSTLTASDVWNHATRTLTSFGTLAADTANAVWSAATRTLTGFGTLVSDVWGHATRTLTSVADSAGVTTLLSRVVGTIAAGTHQPQSGDSFARIGANGSGLTALGDSRLANLDAAVSSRAAPGSQMALTPAASSSVASAVWDEPLAGHQAAGSSGAALASAGTGGIPTNLQSAILNTAAIVQTLSSETVARQPLVVGGVIRVARGYDYGPSAGRLLAVSSEDWPDLTGAQEVRLCERNAARTLVHPMTVAVASPVGAQTVRLDLTAAQTSAMQAGDRLLRIAARLQNGSWADLADVVLSAK